MFNFPPTESMTEKKNFIFSIQAVRGMAAFAVVIAHSLEHGGLGGTPALFTGRFGVEVFFVISGFVITLASGQGRFNPGDYAVRRFARVVPLYWGTTLLVAGLAIALPSIFKSTVFYFEYFWKSMLFIPDTVPFRPLDWRPIFKLGWTLNYEIFFYLLVGLLFWCRSGLLRTGILLSVMSVLLIASFTVENRSSIFAFYANLNLLPFMCGVIICEIYRNRSDFLALLHKVRWPFLPLMVATLYYALQYSHDEYRMLPGHFALTSAAVVVVLTIMSFDDYFTKHGGFWNWIGDISYSLYLLHMFVVGFIWAVVGKLGLSDNGPAIALAIIANLIGSLILAQLSFKFFETPIYNLAKNWRRSKRDQSVPAKSAW